MKNKLKISSISIFCIAAVFNVASAAELTAEEDFKMALRAMPELADDLDKSTTNKSATVLMKCYVDTPAYDYFNNNICFSSGFARTTTAVFKVDNAPAGSGIIWSNGNCTANNSTCFVPIRQYQSVNVSATVLKPNGTYSIVNATAHYEGMD